MAEASDERRAMNNETTHLPAPPSFRFPPTPRSSSTSASDVALLPFPGTLSCSTGSIPSPILTGLRFFTTPAFGAGAGAVTGAPLGGGEEGPESSESESEP